MPGIYTTGYKLFYKDMGPWNSSTNYNPGETVIYNFTTYLCIFPVTSLPPQTPDIATTFWVTITNPSVISDLGDSSLISATSVRGRTIDGLIEKEYLINFFPALIPNYAQSSLFGVGYNLNGQLGTNNTSDSLLFVQTVAGGNDWKSVVNYSDFTAAIKKDGSLWLWGGNTAGQLGDNTRTSRSSPVQTVTASRDWKQVAVNNARCAAIKIDGTLWLWGDNSSGSLGDNTTSAKSSPVQTIAGGTDWKQVATGFTHTAAIKTDGTLWTWGYGGEGALGNNATGNRSSPVQTITGGNNWSVINCMQGGVSAIKVDGTLWLWGANYFGTLGTNNTTLRSSPVQTITGGNNWKSVTGSDNHILALKTDGTLWTWGLNTEGPLGDNTTVDKSSPVQTISGGTDWRQLLNVYGGMSGAIKQDGTLWVWGRNLYGGLGTNSYTDRSSPVQTVAGGNGWRTGSIGYHHMMAIRDLTDI